MNQKKRVFILISLSLAFIIGLTTFILVNSNKDETSYRNYSTRFTSPTGTHALYRILKERNFPVEKNYFSIEKIPELQSKNLVMIRPSYYFKDKEEIALEKNIHAGTWLLIITSKFRNPVNEMGLLTQNPDEKEPFSIKKINNPIVSSFEIQSDSIELFIKEKYKIPYSILEFEEYEDEVFFYSLHHPVKPLITDSAGHFLAGISEIGKGGIIFLTTPHPFTNLGLKHPGNLKFVLNLFSWMQEKHPGPILFDEYHHGFQVERIASPSLNPEIRWMLIALFITLFLAVMSGLRKPIQVVPITNEPRRSVSEFLSSMANLYHRKKGTFYLFMESSLRFSTRLKICLGLKGIDILKNPNPVLTAASAKWGEEESKALKEILIGLKKAHEQEKQDLTLLIAIRKFSIKNKLDQNLFVK